ncbi:uncharacterized protein LOC115973619 isoform X2 [Quercus lobata]|uniref:uncharacterized protein LOC115973619 isoform X2 n=1 Tax=Quercus lobata TaxID=97700 RepID=UPI001243A1F6|nr:uncharacterized protein LOC115973619 isoform X2 [Quercus lobata]
MVATLVDFLLPLTEIFSHQSTPVFPEKTQTPQAKSIAITSQSNVGEDREQVKITLEFATIIVALAEPPFNAGSVLRFIISNVVGNEV